MIIAVTGTPGTGKTTLSKELAKELGFAYLDLNAMIRRRKWHERKDEKRDTLVVDETMLSGRLLPLLKDGTDYIIDSHLSHFLDSARIDLCIVCTCEIGELRRRLDERWYPPQKVRENLDAEIFETCRREAEERHHKLLIVRTERETDVKAVAARIRRALGMTAARKAPRKKKTRTR